MLLPLLPLRDLVVFPHMVAPLFVGRTKSVNALADAMNKDKLVFLSTQKKANVDNPGKRTLTMLERLVRCFSCCGFRMEPLKPWWKARPEPELKAFQ